MRGTDGRMEEEEGATTHLAKQSTSMDRGPGEIVFEFALKVRLGGSAQKSVRFAEASVAPSSSSLRMRAWLISCCFGPTGFFAAWTRCAFRCGLRACAAGRA